MGRRIVACGLIGIVALSFLVRDQGVHRTAAASVMQPLAVAAVPMVTRVITSGGAILDGPVVSSDGWAYAIDGASDGKRIVYAFGPVGQVMSKTVQGSDAVLPGNAGVASILSDAGRVTAYSFVQHRPLWLTDLRSAPVATPLLLPNGTLNILTRDGTVTSLFPLDGSVQRTVSFWKGDRSFDPRGKHYLFASGDGTYLYFFDGTAVFAAGPDGFAFSIMLSDWLQSHLHQFAVPSAGYLDFRAIGPTRTGLMGTWYDLRTVLRVARVVAINNRQEFAWSLRLPAVPDSVSPFPTASLQNGDIVLAENGGTAFRLSRSRIVWQSHDRLLAALSTPPTVDSKGAVYVGSQAGVVASLYARDGGNRWSVQLPFQEPVVHVAPTPDGGAWVATQTHIYGLIPPQGFSLPMTITPQPPSGKRLRWSLTWTGLKKPAGYIAVVYHYSGKTSIGDEQMQLSATATSFTAQGQCGRTYYLRIRAVGAGFPATYYAPADGIMLQC